MCDATVLELKRRSGYANCVPSKNDQISNSLPNTLLGDDPVRAMQLWRRDDLGGCLSRVVGTRRRPFIEIRLHINLSLIHI